MREKLISFGMFAALVAVVAFFWSYSVEVPDDDQSWMDTNESLQTEAKYTTKVLEKYYADKDASDEEWMDSNPSVKREIINVRNNIAH